MKIPILFPILAFGCANGQTILFSDSFDVADTTNFDTADLTGRRSGTLAADVVLRSWGFQQDISGNQALLPSAGSNGLRFESVAGTPGGANRFDWAAGETGQAILESGGFTVSFDWTPPGVTENQWISFQVGTVNADSGNLTNDDYGILFRQNGDTQRFNGALIGAGGTFAPTAGPRKVVIRFDLTSFADGEEVTATSSVDGTVVATDVFPWVGNGGEMRMELGNNNAGQLIDNLTVELNSPLDFVFDLDTKTFSSSQATGSQIALLSAQALGVPADATFTLVAGEGDTDNDKFQITGDSLEVGSFSFLDGGSIDGQEFLVRIQAANDSGPEVWESAIVLKIIKDDDGDEIVDDWELRWAGNLTDFPAPDGDSDGDGLTDLQEFQVSQGQVEGVPAYLDLDPTKPDTDGDELSDNDEVFPQGGRSQSNPTLADTDSDGLSDLVEDNSGTFVGPEATGTSPLTIDTDLDGARDPWEIEQGSDPSDAASFPGSASPQVTLVQITDDASSQIDPAKTYTHAISGGEASNVNGVDFESLTVNVSPANFLWETGTFTKAVVANNNRDWIPADGGVTGSGILDLLGDFTYSGTGTGAGASQTYTLSGLTPGASYDLRFYIRPWAFDATLRPIDLTFINGDEVTTPFGALPEDRPGIVLGTGNNNNAYFLSYQYTAQTSELQVSAGIHPSVAGVSGSFHMFGLTNEVATPLVPVITNTGFAQNGAYVIQFSGPPSRTFEVVKSLDLASGFAPMSPSLQVTTDGTGFGQAIVPLFQVGEAKAFFRLEPTL